MFENRHDAGKQLALLLTEYKASDAIVYALPRGGVTLGYEIAQHLNLPLELVIVRKIGHPDNPEYAIGAVSETGRYVVNEQEKFIDQKWLKEEIKKEQQEAIRRRRVYYAEREEINVTGKTAIIVDDGMATGLSLSLAINEIRAKKPKDIIVAVPIISREAANLVNKMCHKLIAIEIIDGYFGSVGNYYKSFNQVSDGEVIELLHRTFKMIQ